MAEENNNQPQPPEAPQPPKQPSPNRTAGPNGQPPVSRTTVISIILALMVAFFVGSQFMSFGQQQNMQTDALLTSEFVQAVDQGRVTKVVYAASDYTVSGTYYPAATAGAAAADAFNGAFDSLNARIATFKDADGSRLGGVATETLSPVQLGNLHNFTSTYVGSDSLGELMAAHPEIQYEIQLPNPFLAVLTSILPILIIGALLFFFFIQMQKANNSQMSFGKAKTKKAAEERPDVKFSDVAGVDEAVEEMQEIKDFLANPAKYQSMGAKIPRGCLLVGPPGTGKTLLARAVAGEAGVPFFSISGSDFVEMFVGVGASRVRDLFQQAKEAAPAIIFIDEIDAVGRQRGTGLGGGHDEREQTLNQLLVEMDGFESNDSVVLLAATNRSDVLDPALLRPGRFDRQIVVDTPDVKGREKILNVHAKDKPIGSDVDLAKIAKITPGFTGADLANLMNESALLTARRGKKIITMREVSESMERVIAGPERKGRVMNEKTKHTIAYHESGHALVGHLLSHADPVHKISIVSRGRALGYTLSIPDEDKLLNTLSEMKDELAVFMGGRVAEEIFCDDITTGASNDLERASKMARAIVTQYGMSPLGTQVFGQPNHEVFLGRDYGNTQDYSEETARRIDEQVSIIMKEAHDRAHDILEARRDQMDLMASVLLERETVEGEACEALLDNKWDEYLAREGEIIAAKEAEEAAARAKDEQLADPNWREEPVEPGDQDANGPFRPAAEDADTSDMPTQAEVDAEIDREDLMDSSPDNPDPDKNGD
ncbi:MAG: ATP-dependent metallopeptidase FtsH/Yme1/Tma family protein [Eggerthellaceae bacterium]|nr:ATP-dependent metallopeptidase FtsH/Yme1/Tma family protein [Eggerthellaceae bacterium]